MKNPLVTIFLVTLVLIMNSGSVFAQELAGSFKGKVPVKPPTKTRVIWTNDNLRPVPVSPSVTPIAPGVPPLALNVSPEEKGWRDRAYSLRTALYEAERDLSRMETEIPVMVGYGNQAGYAAQEMNHNRTIALAPYVLKVREAKSALEALPEECRRSQGCQPGWVR